MTVQATVLHPVGFTVTIGSAKDAGVLNNRSDVNVVLAKAAMVIMTASPSQGLMPKTPILQM